MGTGEGEDEDMVSGFQGLVSGREPPLGARVGIGEGDVEKVVSGFQALVSGREPGFGAVGGGVEDGDGGVSSCREARECTPGALRNAAAEICRVIKTDRVKMLNAIKYGVRNVRGL